jgi:phosphate-selective porin OprO/OprP
VTGGDRAHRPLRGGVCPLFALALLLASSQVGRPDDLAVPPPSAGEQGDPVETSPEKGDADSGASEGRKALKLRWSAGLHVTGEWEYLHVKLGGDLQNDTAGYVSTESADQFLGTEINDGVEWRRARLYAEGRLLRTLEFKLRYDFTAGNPPNLKDAYFSLVNLPLPTAGLTVGRFKAPLGLDGYTGADDLVFMERSLMTEAFLPSRNTGFMLHGDSPRKRVRWSFAVLQPEAEDVGLSSTDDLGWSARFSWAFTKGKRRTTLVHLGADFWRRNVSNTIQVAARPESHLAPYFVDTGDIAAEHSDVTILEAAVQPGGVTIESGFGLARISSTGRDTVDFHGFYAQASWFLTGEKRPYRTDRGTFARPYPKRSVRDRGTGALEVAFRFSRVVLDDGAVAGGTLDDWSAAFSWYPTYHLRLMLNAILANPGGAKPVGVFQMRMQVAY